MISRLIDPEAAWRVYTQYGVPKTNACTMCGGYCPMMWAREQAKKVVV
jgi:phosphomethylpyrimidine synthase